MDRVRAHDLQGHRLFRGDFNRTITRDLADYYGDAVDPPWRFYLLTGLSAGSARTTVQRW